MLDSKKCITILFKRELLDSSFTQNKQYNTNITDTVQNLLLCLESLKINAPWSKQYPIKIFYDDHNLGLFEIQYFLQRYANVSFHVFPAEDPTNFNANDHKSLNHIIQKQQAQGRATRNLGYRRMCYWYSYALWRHPELKQYDYIMRMDTDSVIWSRCDFDFFQVIQDNNLNYLYRIVQKVDNFSEELHSTANTFLKSFDNHTISDTVDIRSLNRTQISNQELSDYNYVFNNFFVAKSSFFKERVPSKLLSKLVASKNIYLKRWGDANIHSILLQLSKNNIDLITNYGNFEYGKWGLVWKSDADRREQGQSVSEKLFNSLDPNQLFSSFNNFLELKIKERSIQLKNAPAIISQKFHSILKSNLLGLGITDQKTYTPQQHDAVQSALKDMKGSFLGHEAVVLSCGPSIKDYSKEQINNFCQGKLVACVKETFLEFPDSHLWFVNDSRWQKFDVPTTSAFTIYTHAIHNTAFKAAKQNVFYDLYLQEQLSTKDLHEKEQLINKRNFHDFNFENNLLRPWGPGILYESVFYLLLHLGIRNCYTLGWDLSLTGQLNHYFDDSTDSIYANSVRGYQKDLQSFESSWDQEMKDVINASRFIYRYFRDMNLNLYILSKQSLVSKEIPRLSLT